MPAPERSDSLTSGAVVVAQRIGQHALCIGLPLTLALVGAAAAAFAQAPPDAPVPVAAVSSDIPEWVLAMLSTGGFGVLLQLLRSGGLPLRHTVELADRDRDLLRDLRDHLTRTR